MITETLLQLLNQIPVVQRKDIVRADHHNKVKGFLKKWLELNKFDQDAPEVYGALNQIPERSRGDMVYPEDWNNILGILVQIKQLISQYSEEFRINVDQTATYYYTLLTQRLQQLKEVSVGDVIESDQYNLRRGCLECLAYLVRLLKGILLFDWEAWDYAKIYVTDKTIVILGDFTMTKPSASEIQQLLNDYKMVIVKEIDTGPYYRRAYPNLYGILYNTLRPSSPGSFNVYIVPDYLKSKLGTAELVVCYDYIIRTEDRVPGYYAWAYPRIPMWPLPVYAWRPIGRGVIIELPYDAYWRTQSTLDAFMDWLAYAYLLTTWADRIIYMGGYTTEYPGFHGGVSNITTFWYGIAENRGLKVYDMRGT